MSSREFNVDAELARRRRSFAQKRSLSVYGVSLPDQPEDLTGVHPRDDRFNFFSRGRDFQPRKAKHRFTDDELKTVETFESAAVLPSCSEVYRQWLKKSPSGGDSWVIISMIAIITGILASVMKLAVEKFQLFYIPFISHLIEKGAYDQLWIYYPLLGCAFSVMSAVVVVYFCPFAAGSGLPEIIGILNGCVVRNVLNFKTLACKMISCIFTVISTLPVGFEGPMVHIGALVGACMAKPIDCQSLHKGKEHDPEKSQTTHCFPKLCHYRDCRERHSLICVGAAAGVAAAFSSPIAGLTFAMEEMSSHWSKTLTWQAFVCCILARSTAELLRSLFAVLESLEDHETTFVFRLSESALFDMRKILNLNMAIFIPAAIMGVIGGLLGSIFIFVLLKVSKFRRKTLASIKNTKLANAIKILEVIVVSLLSSAAVMLIMNYSTCKAVKHFQVLHDPNVQGAKYFRLRAFQCKNGLNVSLNNNELLQIGEFNDGASLLFGSWEQMIRNLFSRRTVGYFDVPMIISILGLFLVFASWSSITSIASGLLIPQLAIGALYGRAIGQFVHDIFINSDQSDTNEWDWIDPGALALLGSASFISGTSRLPVTSVVMMMEMTNDVNVSLLIMLCVMLSKVCGDLFTHSLYHSMLDFKCIPYLESELKIYNDNKRINLELFRAEDVMKCPVEFVGVKENVYALANLLLDTNHGGFPVVQVGDGFHRTFLGVITRLELTILLTKTKKFDARELVGEDIDRIRLSYPEYSSGRLKDLETVNNILHSYSTGYKYKNVHVNLLPYINTSAIAVPKDFSLYRTYMMFRFLGLRHMVVVDRHNQVQGIITRKDLLGYTVEKKLKFVLNNNFRRGFYIGSPSGTSSERSPSGGSSSSPSTSSPASATTTYEVISRADSMTVPPAGLQSCAIPEEPEEEEN